MPRKRKRGRNVKTGNPVGKPPPTPEFDKSISATVYQNIRSGNKKPCVHRGTMTNKQRNITSQRSRNALSAHKGLTLHRAKYQPKDFEEAKQAIQALGPCKHGKSHSRETIKTFIRAVSLLIVKYRAPFTNSCQFVANIFGAGLHQIRGHCRRWFTSQQIQVTDNSRRGAGSDKYGTSRHVLKKEHLQTIVQYIDNQNIKRGGVVSTPTIQTHLTREYGRTHNLSTIYYAVKTRLGYVFKKPHDLRVAMTAKRLDRLLKHWLQRDLAIKLERAGKAVMYYIDESYVHQNHFPLCAYFHPDRPEVVRPAGKGQRCIIVHAASRHGLAFAEVNGERPSPDEFDSAPYPTAEMVYRAKSRQSWGLP